MQVNKKRGENLLSILVMPLVLLIFGLGLCAYGAESDFSCLKLSPKNTIKLENPAGYAGAKNPTNQTKINISTFNDIPSPSEYRNGKRYTPSVDELLPVYLDKLPSPTEYFNKKLDVVTKEESNLSPKNNANSSPPRAILEDDNLMSNFPSPSEFRDNSYLFTPPAEEMVDVYPVNAEQGGIDNAPSQGQLSYEQINAVDEEDVDFEGRKIANIRCYGLSALHQDYVLSHIATKEGSLYDSNTLQEDLQRIYNLGYFTDDMTIEPLLNTDGTIDLRFTLEENIIVPKVTMIGNRVISTAQLQEYVASLQGLPQNLYLINEAISGIENRYYSEGYILAKVSSVDDDSNGNLTFTINEGVIDKIVLEGNKRTKDYIIERNMLTEAGSVYNEDTFKKDLAKIYATQIFEDVDRVIEPNGQDDGRYTVKVVVKEKATNSLSIGGGIDTGLGIFGSVGVREDNFLGKNQKIALSGMVGSGILLSDASIKNRVNYQFELSFIEPHFINADNSLTSKIYFKDLGSYQVPLAIERRYGISGTIEHKVRNYDNLSTYLGLGIENIDLQEGNFNSISELYAKNNIDISRRKEQLADGLFFNISPGIKYSHLDDESLPRNGYIAKAKYIESIGITDFKHTNGRAVGSVTKYFPVASKSTISIGASGGLTAHGDKLPEVMAFRLGGPYNVRGFRMNGVGSGESYLAGTVQLETPFLFIDRLKWEFLQKVRFTMFVDGGKIFDPTITSKLYDRPLGAITAGIGIKVYIPGVGPISVDYGIPLTNPGSFGSKNGYFTFGTGDGNIY